MTYLLHPSSSYTAPETPGRDGASRDLGGGSLSVLLQGVRSLLHGEPSPVARASNNTVDGSGSSTKRFQSSRGVQLSTSSSGAGAAHVSRVSGAVGHGGSSARSSGTAFPWPASTPVAPSTGSESLVHLGRRGAGSASATTDATLYEHAVQYVDLEEVLRCPLPPVPGCPTPCTFGRHSTGLNRSGGVSSATTVSPPPQPSSSPRPLLVFRCIAADPETGISVYSTPVEDCPMHLMRAYAVLPCAPRDVLQYMDNNIRPSWDTHLRRSALLRELAPPAQSKEVKRQYRLSSFISTSEATLGQQSPTSLSGQSRATLHPLTPSALRATDDVGGEGKRAAVSDSAIAASSSAAAFQYLPGQRRVAIHYLETRTPVPLVQDRDFEIVTAEEVRCDGTAYMKAFSTPLGYHMPLDPHQSRYVRAVVLFSGMIARPIDAASLEDVLPPVLLRRHRAASQPRTMSGDDVQKRRLHVSTTVSDDAAVDTAPRQYCVMEYVGLVHPMGLLPAVLVNMVISAQLNAIRKLQGFIMQHPISSLRPRSVECAPAKGATLPPLRELSGSLQSPADSPHKKHEGERSPEGRAAQRETHFNAGSGPIHSSPGHVAESRASLWWRRQRHRLLSHL
ncbi:hypothetical protein JKF63_05632 [Porcisia hertigi]|uniref:START domain-containing protein n=1 Tax=Porcisia hertigi TaxID=2761500 RepID=A0A836ILK9_9TRYP|nr:hypothetical protein JKF63_05632 [Porcisia hertigi]